MGNKIRASVDTGARGTLAAVYAWLHERGVPEWFGYGLLERVANVALFVPIGLLVGMLARPVVGPVVGPLVGRARTGRWWWWWAVVGPAAFSAAAELGQLVLRPERFASWGDVVANTVGAALGVVVAGRVMAPGRSARRASPRRRAHS
ncbi:VanZ family protein [Cellulomonas fimi]|uniref:VanZ family protein n=1 Tax=Cellulomonas fimi TaxID=1708 RepID=A0A7Y0QI39_CELFI|nr:VanZ family protein [Cellulomonas fimi]NMR20519.1 VanZ family protein [Cellulomonas fimi]